MGEAGDMVGGVSRWRSYRRSVWGGRWGHPDGSGSSRPVGKTSDPELPWSPSLFVGPFTNHRTAFRESPSAPNLWAGQVGVSGTLVATGYVNCGCTGNRKQDFNWSHNPMVMKLKLRCMITTVLETLCDIYKLGVCLICRHVNATWTICAKIWTFLVFTTQQLCLKPTLCSFLHSLAAQ